MNIDIDIAIFLGFLAVNLVVGLRHGSKNKTISDYALGGREFSTAALVATIVATWVSGSGFFIELSNIYSDGLYFLIPACCMSLSLVITASFLIPRMKEFMGKISVAQAMGDMYGKEVRFITAVSGILGTVGLIAVQFKVFGNVFHHFFAINSTNAVLIAAAIVIVYSAFGGIRAVTYTDIVQFGTFGFVIPMIGVIIWNHMYDSGITIFDALKNPNFDYQQVLNFHNPRFWEIVPLMLYFGLPGVKAMDFQRISMGRSIDQVQKAWYISAVLIVLVILATAWIPFLLGAITADLPADEIMSHVADNYAYTGLRGLIIIGIAAMAMSTADSCINASAVLFGNDIKQIFDIKLDELLVSKLFALLLGTFATYLALSKTDLLNIVLTSASLYMPVVTVPLLAAILGFRSSRVSVLIAMSGGLLTVIFGNIFSINANIIIAGMSVNLLLLIGSHYLLKQPGGWVKAKENNSKENNSIDKITLENKSKIWHLVWYLFDLVQGFNFIEFCRRTAPKNELMYTGLGIYCILYTFTAMYTTQVELLKEKGKIILGIYQIMMCTGTVMAMYPIWPPRIRKEIIVQVAWNIVIFYMLVLFSCFFVMVSNFGQLQFAVFTMNVLITAVLVGWKLGAGMMVVGFYMSMQFYKFYTGVDIIDISPGSPQFILMYSLMLLGSSFIIFLKPKEEQHNLTEKHNGHLTKRVGRAEEEAYRALEVRNEFIRNLHHEVNTPMVGIKSLAPMLLERLDTMGIEEVRRYLMTVVGNHDKFDSLTQSLLNLSKIKSLTIELNKTRVNLSELLEERLFYCSKLYTGNKELEFKREITPNVVIECDKYYISSVFDNLIVNALQYSKKGTITVRLRKKDLLKVEFQIIDEGIGIPQNELRYIFGMGITSSKTKTPAGGRGYGLSVCEGVVTAHKGYITAESNGEKGATFTVELPIVDMPEIATTEIAQQQGIDGVAGKC